nr:hypothetical protein Q903MT_gene6167 [Picea sitchensis]
MGLHLFSLFIKSPSSSNKKKPLIKEFWNELRFFVERYHYSSQGGVVWAYIAAPDDRRAIGRISRPRYIASDLYIE